jgi:predicted TIM-barrel fold metal-dependent hydrolase
MNLNTAINEAINKGAAKATRKPLAGLRRDVAQLKREVADLKRLVRDLRRQAQTVPTPETDKPEAPMLRPTSKAVLKLRRKLGLSQAEFGKLAGVS